MAKLGLFLMVVVANIVDIIPEDTIEIAPISGKDLLAKLQAKIAPVSGDGTSAEGDDYAFSIQKPKRPSRPGGSSKKDGWIKIGSNWFQAFEDLVTWSQAQGLCVGKGGSLASIHDNATNVGVLDLLPSSVDRMWIGGYKSSGRWTWENNSPWIFEAWHIDNPSGDGPCAEIIGDNNGETIGWNDLACDHRRGYICQKETAFFCPDGWKKFNQNCYNFVEKTLSWKNAENHCKQEGGHLASVNSKEENDFIRTISSGVFWLGLTDFKEGVWIWSDGSPFAFNNWSGSGPSNSGGNEDCVHGTQEENGNWNDINCASTFNFMCKKDMSF